ncbi:chemotaxis protein CheB [Desulfobotulus mexicanus]|uniref:PAS domain-containing protein n=1 Tax=Desulfobotulus mexicanus TaxID=2586642 RepID=A0A5S5MER1_9BACT|nr:chemotaxis protein CheB [Desulfobotulus mexicanus]TYT74211.1 PAS domain-containing protein [Desulfobotulus mexicanus]
MTDPTCPQKIQKPVLYVGIGASAGGLEAIEDFFSRMPDNTGLAFIVIQHLSPDHKSLMVEILSKRTPMPVHRAETGQRVSANTIYLIPPKKNLTIFHGKLILNDQETSKGINLPIDLFLSSLAEDKGEKAVAIILSGTGSDGTRGIRAIKENGGMIMVQREDSARFDGMPRSAIATGLADFILSPDEMPEQLIAFASHPAATSLKTLPAILTDEDNLARIFVTLRQKTKVDFTFYKPSTIVRRIERRMIINQIEKLADYAGIIEHDPGEAMTLYREMLIGVTSFFRDPETFQLLFEKYMPALFQKAGKREIRFWVAGCSTGEEAYTLAILAKECMENLGINHDVKIFATDIDRNAIVKAGDGVYSESIAADIAPYLLSKYFYHTGESFKVARNIRQMVVFAQHNLIKDPPFTKIDLISCRNLLIYFQPVLQQKIFEFFNFSLIKNGILLLGSSESIGELTDYFDLQHHKSKIFISRGQAMTSTGNIGFSTPREKEPGPAPYQTGIKRTRRPQTSEDRLMDRFLELLSEHYIPTSIIVNEKMELIHSLGDTEGFLKLPPGRVVYDVSKMTTKELSIPLSTGIQKAFRTGKAISYTNIHTHRNRQSISVNLKIIPLPDKKGEDALAAIFLETLRKQDNAEGEKDVPCYDLSDEVTQRIKDLEHELQFTKENLQATIEELETANEELQATNEELMASNEELQSTNEELQSTNEELHTVNSEYQNKIMELTEANNDVENLLTSSQIGKIILDDNLCIRKFSPHTTHLFNLFESDTGRPLIHLTHRLKDFDPARTARMVQDTGKPMELEIESEQGYSYLARILPYRVSPKVHSGVIMTFIDITELQKARKKMLHQDEALRDTMQIAGIGSWYYEPQNKEFHASHEIRQYIPEFSNKIDSFLSIQHAKGTSSLKQAMEDAEKKGSPFDIVFMAKTIDSKIVWLRCIGNPESDHHKRIIRITGVLQDISEFRQMTADLERAAARHDFLFETMDKGIVYQKKDGKIIDANPAALDILGLTRDEIMGRTSKDKRWKAMDEEGKNLEEQDHPSMTALRTGKTVRNFIMQIFNPRTKETKKIRVDAIPIFCNENKTADQVYTIFEDITATGHNPNKENAPL